MAVVSPQTSSESTAPASVARRKRTLVAAASVYFAIVFATGLILGPIRVVYLEPWLGRTLAVLLETPFLFAAMAFAGRWAPIWTKLAPTVSSLLGVGVLALVFQEVADLAVGFGLRGMTLTEQVALFRTPPGWIYIFDLVVFALAPLMARRRALDAPIAPAPPSSQ